MKKNSLQFIALYIFSLLIINSNGGRVPYFLFYALNVALLISVAHIVFMVVFIKYTQSVQSRFVVKGDEVLFDVILSNETPIFFPFMRVSFLNSSEVFVSQYDDTCITLPPHTTRTFSYKIICKYRGEYSFGLAYIEFYDFFNIISYKYKIKYPYLITVYPRVVKLNHLPIAKNLMADSVNISPRGTEDFFAISDLRNYAYGDSTRKIHWKMLAKTGDLYVKNFETTTKESCVLILDLVSRMSMEMQDKLIEAAVSVTYYCLLHQMSVQLLLCGKSMVTVSGSSIHDFDAIYTTMASIMFDTDEPPVDVVPEYLTRVKDISNIWVFTSRLDMSMPEWFYGAGQNIVESAIVYFFGNEEASEVNEEVKQILKVLSEWGTHCFTVRANDEISSALFEAGSTL